MSGGAAAETRPVPVPDCLPAFPRAAGSLPDRTIVARSRASSLAHAARGPGSARNRLIDHQ
ncbi:MAG: hypothetical protein F4103_12250 [Boseongicola sp. SB0673_bin_14]|nr:hypothetical protein [Boseongicola sp. SB0673_bin_14]